MWAGLKGRLRLPAPCKCGKLLPLRAGSTKGRDRRASAGQEGSLAEGPLPDAVHKEHSLCQDSCLNHPLCLPLGEPNQQFKGKGIFVVWSMEFSFPEKGRPWAHGGAQGSQQEKMSSKGNSHL